MTTFNVPDMSCGHCKAAIEKAVTAQDEGALLDFDMEARKVSVDSVLDDDVIARAMAAEGYPSTVAA